jgi:mannose-1-phosphate guanylyltransferase/mannose-6-phosphate isomerase
MNTSIYPVILAGGSGTRLWPRSREKYPKQFIPLIDGKSLFQETCLRFSDVSRFPFLTVITHEEHRFLVRDQLREIGITNAPIITEPLAKNTAAACLSGAYFLQKTVGNVPTLFVPADHVIRDPLHLIDAIENVSPFVIDGSIAIFGIAPTSPHTGYGYIKGEKVLGKGVLLPSLFIEKPNKEKAEKLIVEGAFWNSGIYFCTPSTLVTEATLYMEELHTILHDFFSKTKNESTHGFFMIDKTIYDALDSISIDKGIAEHTKKLVLADTKIDWSDLGSWSSLYEHFDKDNDGNVLRGDVVVSGTTNSYIESDERLVTVIGLENIGVVETGDAIMVFPLGESESVKKMVNTLSERKRKEMTTHLTTHRPWGKYTILGDDAHFQSKKITVLPGAGLSLQRHKHRAEHWIVIKGVATVTNGERVFELRENESTFIPMGAVHRLENKHDEILSIVEIQTGTYFGEDDIERLDDTYGRR